MMRRRSHLLVGAAFVAGCLAAGGLAVPDAASADLCVPVILPCADPSPASTPTPSTSTAAEPQSGAASSTVPSDGAQQGDPESSPSPTPADRPAAEQTVPLGLLPKDDSMVFTQPSAQLGVSSLSFTGLKGIALVSIRLADGKRIPALRLRADSITMDGFALTVRATTGPALITKADRMALTGDVSVYVNSLTATTPDGKSLTLGANTPPPTDGITPTLVRVTLGLVGSRADQIVYTNTDQQLKG